MRLAQLRHQMLIAMGLPACWTQPSAPQPAAPTAVAAPAARPNEPAIAMFDPRSCKVDMVVETMCGRIEGEYCDPTGARLQIAHGNGLHVTPWNEAEASAKDFILDDRASEGYVGQLHGMGENLEGKPACCYSRCTPLVVGQPRPGPAVVPPGYMRSEQCIPEPLRGTTMPEPTHASCPVGVRLGGEIRPFASARTDQCCYTTMYARVIKGRPARVDGVPEFADVGGGTGWQVAVAVAPVDAAARAALAASWLEAARMEHASIAAFSATSLRLLALGAPPELIAATHRAALDEIEHARIAFALASAYAERPLAPAQFAAVTKLGAMTVRELAVETFVDGCIGEGAAAIEAARAATTAVDPQLAEVLETIARDEASHAALAWQIVRWCVQQEPSIVDALRGALAEASQLASLAPADDGLAAHGVLGARARQLVHADVIREVVTPCFEALAA